MKITTLIRLCVLISSSTVALADLTPPSPPTVADLADNSACVNYSQQMENYLDQFSNFSDLMNSTWFVGFSSPNANPVVRQSCVNGVCTNYWNINDKGYGTSPGCTLAATGAQSAKQNLLNYLNQAYQAAISHQNIKVRYDGFGLYGPSNVCVSGNSYLGCQFYYK